MTNYAADDFQAIERRRQEIKAEREQALTGTSAPVTGQEQKTEELPQGYGYAGICYSEQMADAYKQLFGGTAGGGLSSLAHPNWPYAGTGFEWRRFVRS